jgi:hypothetical protein
MARVAGHGAARGGAPQEGVFAQAWDWIAQWWGGVTGERGISRLWAAEGPGIDPDGSHASTNPTTQAGPGLDPDGGRTSVSPMADMGPGLDPNGGH